MLLLLVLLLLVPLLNSPCDARSSASIIETGRRFPRLLDPGLGNIWEAVIYIYIYIEVVDGSQTVVLFFFFFFFIYGLEMSCAERTL